jgi:hypothetical protein
MDNIPEKIELIQDQITNLEKSGFYTEADMDRLTKPLRLELSELISAFQTKTAANYSGKSLTICSGIPALINSL